MGKISPEKNKDNPWDWESSGTHGSGVGKLNGCTGYLRMDIPLGFGKRNNIDCHNKNWYKILAS